MRQLYDRGMSGPDIRNLYEFIDWTSAIRFQGNTT